GPSIQDSSLASMAASAQQCARSLIYAATVVTAVCVYMVCQVPAANVTVVPAGVRALQGGGL
ncbi:MAG: hypothetical protein KGJ86_08395, partial [Chloroflexota bacterium]|nr:hypothetical protein [Chloroflexota bacterium]